MTPAQATAHGSRGFIPCPECAEKITMETLNTLIRNRTCIHPFPKDDEDAEYEARMLDLVVLLKTMHSIKVYMKLKEGKEPTAFGEVMKATYEVLANEIKINYGEKEILYAIQKARSETIEP